MRVTVQSDDSSLRSDVRTLGDLLGQSLVRQEGQALLDLVEAVRKSVKSGTSEEVLRDVTVTQAVQLVRAFSTYFHLANVAEQVHRARVLEEDRAHEGSWLSRALTKIEKALADGTITREDLKTWIAELSVRPVFTAHPRKQPDVPF